jgi:hypothetical protein
VKVVVPTERGYWKRMTGLFVLSAAIAGLTIAQVVHSGTANPAFLVFAAVVLLLPTPFLIQRQQWIASLDDKGVTLRSGKQYKWTDFESCTPRLLQRQPMRGFVNNYDLRFKTRTVGLYHRMAPNQFELEAIARELMAGTNRFTSVTSPRPA